MAPNFDPVFNPSDKLPEPLDPRLHLAAVVNSADDAIISKDLNGIVTSWNAGAQRMFGYTPEEMIGQSILRIIPEKLHYEEAEILRTLRAGKRIDHFETTRRNKNGSLIEVSETISPVRDENGHLVGASKIARDISDRKRVERLLIQSEKIAATGRMAAAVAHEINNPLESVMNLIYLARQSSSPDGKAHKFLLTAEEELERVSHIARQTLGFYHDSNTPTELYIHDLIESALTVYKARMLSAGISVDTRFSGLQKATVSKGEMLQVLSNVIVNAIDAMPDGGLLQITTHNVISSGKEGIETTIQDNGIGIQPEYMDKIFEPFFTTKGSTGTGIGLWVAKQLLEKRGASIALESRTEKGNSGTTFTIFIPFSVPQLDTAADNSDQAELTTGIR